MTNLVSVVGQLYLRLFADVPPQRLPMLFFPKRSDTEEITQGSARNAPRALDWHLGGCQIEGSSLLS